MAEMGKPLEQPSGPAGRGPVAQSIWSSIHPKLLELIRSHKSTLLFVNSRRLAERLAGALNELAGEALVRAHHGSLARAQRTEIEDLLKGGHLRALVATSSLELGIDMGAIDLVIQIEAPPSVASGLQRIGRAGHRIDEVSEGIIFPKFRGDLVACAAVTAAMRQGKVESSRYPRNPLDVLAQQLVAMAAMERWPVDELYHTVRSAAPFAELSRPIFDGVLDMLSGRYPSDEFAELRPRITWDRVHGTVLARQGAKQVAIANAGTIPDRGLYGVFLSGADKDKARVGELDEEMVFEARAGETFLLGASTWRIDQITHDRVLVSPAPGEPGKMPFWKGEGPGRPVELGMAIGKLVRELRKTPRCPGARTAAARSRAGCAGQRQPAEVSRRSARRRRRGARRSHHRDRTVARRHRRLARGGAVAARQPRARAVGDGRHRAHPRRAGAGCRGDVVRRGVRRPLSGRPGGARHVAADSRSRRSRAARGAAAGIDGDVLRALPRGGRPRAAAAPPPARRAGAAVAAAQARRRSAGGGGAVRIVPDHSRDLSRVPARHLRSAGAHRHPDAGPQPHRSASSTSSRQTPSPFSSSLLFGYVANYIYDGDAPLAERRAQALSVDQSQLRDLIGDTELRDLLDEAALDTLEAELQYLPERFHARSTDAVHDLLLRLGDLSREEIAARSVPGVAGRGRVGAASPIAAPSRCASPGSRA